MAINNIALDGRLLEDLELRKTANKGISVVNLRLAHRSPKHKNPVYVDIEVWGKNAEELCSVAQKGTSVVVHGELRRDKWDHNGDVRSKLKITADRVIVVEKNQEKDVSF